MSARISFLLLFAAACSSGGSEDTDTGGGGGTVRDFSYFVNTQEAPTGDITCAGTAPASVDPAKQVDVTLNGVVADFQEGTSVAEASVAIWLADDISGTPDQTFTADNSGAFSTTVPSCTPLAYETSTPPDWEQTVDTYEVHQIYGYEEDGVVDGETLNSVSHQTSTLIPSIIGINWDTTTGIIAGTAYDCTETGIGNAQVFIHDAAGNVPATGEIFYFDDHDFPADHDHFTATNPNNGLWVAVNVPVGVWIAETYVWNGTDYTMLGSTELNIKAGSVNISNVYTGHSDGISYPASCLAE